MIDQRSSGIVHAFREAMHLKATVHYYGVAKHDGTSVAATALTDPPVIFR
jgi:hypothetical protein